MANITMEQTPERTNAMTLTAADWGLLVLRLALGVIFVAHGSQKVLGWFDGHGLAAFAAGMGKMGVPAPLAYLAAFTEFLGGLGLIFGVLTRLSALGIAVVMLVAIFMVHLPNGFFMNWEMTPGKKHGIEGNLSLLAMAIAIFLMGPGRISFGDWEPRLLRRRG